MPPEYYAIQFCCNIEYQVEDRFMKIDHIAIWTSDLERLKEFYIKYFNVKSGPKYVNSKRSFESYFLQFDSGARIEIMHLPSLPGLEKPDSLFVGYAHIAVSVDSKENVDDITSRMRSDGYVLVSGPRFTGDGYYESVFRDPDGNHLEITI
jgi:lactoylglutathione lyase